LIYELREYNLRNGEQRAYLERLERDFVSSLPEYGIDMVGAWMTSFGPDAYTKYVWLRRWKDLATREQVVHAWESRTDDLFKSYLTENVPRITAITTRLLEPVPFSPLQ
jgi:hypothetical protein